MSKSNATQCNIYFLRKIFRHSYACGCSLVFGNKYIVHKLIFFILNNHILTKVITFSESVLAMKVMLCSTLFLILLASGLTKRKIFILKKRWIFFELTIPQTSLRPFWKALTKLYQESKNCNLAIARTIYTGRYIIVGTSDIVNLHIIMYEQSYSLKKMRFCEINFFNHSDKNNSNFLKLP